MVQCDGKAAWRCERHGGEAVLRRDGQWRRVGAENDRLSLLIIGEVHESCS